MDCRRAACGRQQRVSGWARATVMALLAALAVAVSVTSAQARATSHWYWSPGACKAQLQGYGVKIDDGRTFNVAKAYCVGMHNHCHTFNGLREYKVFDTVMRSFDGVVREMTLTVTGKNSWSGSHLTIDEHHMSPSRFKATYGPAAWTVARSENAGGCFDVHP